ncbi:hypothetical protein SAMN05444354_10635 [Stigmatella aurantiaca]|uniref:Uncharacterized protein n=1 Tax=Stigmatella aurantiaca TaxID=41 RepID=A0A1H7Q7U2_STIAU|nr:hypothetical protein [Stigmatella aurantiaca]SEL43714.1 hypothetical protein SAMN05444354_10635 [Stigmatella aurantiaca]
MLLLERVAEEVAEHERVREVELAYLLDHGKRGRDELVRRFAQEGQEHLSRAWRQPVV